MHGKELRQLKFPVCIAKTSLMPEYSKQVVLLERTVPWEDDYKGGPGTKEGQTSWAARGLQSQWLEGLLWADWGGLQGVSWAISARSSKAPLAWEGCWRGKPPETSAKQQNKKPSRWLWIKRDDVRYSTLLGHKLESDELGSASWGRLLIWHLIYPMTLASSSMMCPSCTLWVVPLTDWLRYYIV